MPTHYSGTSTEIKTLDTFIKLTRCTNAILARLASRHTLDELTPSQFAVLEALYHLGPLTQGEVSSKLLKSVSDITTVIDNLERHNYIHRERDTQDRRVIHVHLTEAGKEKLEAIFPQHVAALVDEFSVLSDSELETLGSLCRKLGKGKELTK